MIKSEFLQIRVTKEFKKKIKKVAQKEGLSMSSYIVSKLNKIFGEKK